MNKLLKMLEALKGKRTYVLAGLGGLVAALAWAGILDHETANAILQLLGFGAIVALRAAKK